MLDCLQIPLLEDNRDAPPNTCVCVCVCSCSDVDAWFVYSYPGAACAGSPAGLVGESY